MSWALTSGIPFSSTGALELSTIIIDIFIIHSISILTVGDKSTMGNCNTCDCDGKNDAKPNEFTLPVRLIFFLYYLINSFL